MAAETRKTAADPFEPELEPDFEAADEFHPSERDWSRAPAEPADALDAALHGGASEAFKSLAAQIVDAFGPDAPRSPGAEPAAPDPASMPRATGGLSSPAAAAADPFAGLPEPTPDLAGEANLADPPPAVTANAIVLPNESVPTTSAAATAPVTPPTFEPSREALSAVAPRITVHAFCDAEATMEIIRAAARDRRMERAATTVRSGGLAAAVEFYQNQPTPSLVILEAGPSADELLRMLGRLAEVCDPGTKVIVIGAANDIGLYRELMRQGISEYLTPPLDVLQLIAAVTTLYADPSAPFVGRQLAFCGAKGGVGASTLAHNAAHCLSEKMAAGTVLVDLDLPFGTGALDFNQDPAQGIADALAHPDRLDPVLMERMMAKQSEHLSLFAAPASLDQDWEIGPDAYEEVIGKIRHAAPYLVLDLPHQWNRWTRRLLLTSDETVVVAEPDLACLRNTKNLVDLIKAARPNDPPPRVVLNKVGMPGRPEIPAKDFSDALGAAPDMIIAFDAKSFGEAANNGQMIAEAASKAKAVEQVGELVRLLTNQKAAAAPPPPARSSILAGLFRRR